MVTIQHICCQYMAAFTCDIPMSQTANEPLAAVDRLTVPNTLATPQRFWQRNSESTYALYAFEPFTPLFDFVPARLPVAMLQQLLL